MPHSVPIRTRGPKATKVDPSHLLDAAQKVFAREGVQGASIRAIAREAGCDPSLLYYHFDSKEEMFAALLERKFNVLTPALEEVANRPLPLRETLWAVLGVFGTHVKTDAGFRALVRGQVINGAEPIKDTLAPYLIRLQRLLGDLFRRGIESGELRGDLAVPVITFLFARTYMEIQDLVPTFATRVVKVSPAQALAMAELEWFNLFWRGIAADPLAPCSALAFPKEIHP